MASQPNHQRRAAGAEPPDSHDALFRLHHQRLMASLQRRLGISREIAEDAVSFAWMTLVRNHPAPDNVVGWLYTVAKHEAFALVRTGTRYQAAEQVEPDQAAPTPARVLDARRTLALLDRLKPQQCLVLRLRMAGLSYQEICRCTGRTYTWVNRHATEGRQALRDLIDHGEA